MLNLWKFVSSHGSTTSLVQVLWFAFALCTLALVACSRWFWGSKDAIFMHFSSVHENWGVSPFSFRTLTLDLLDCFSPLWRCVKWFHLFAIFDPQYNLISSIFPLKGFVITFMEELILYWLSKFFFPFRQSMPTGEKFRGFKGIWVLCFCCICL